MDNCLNIIEEINQLNREVVRLAGEGDFERAISITQKAIKLAKENLGEHPVLADSLNNLVELQRLQGNYVGVEPLLIEILEIRKQLLGTEHPDIAQSLNNLAAHYVNQGLYSEAETIFEQALKIWQINFGEEHEEIATTLNNLAEVYREQGRYIDAQNLHQQALAMRKSLFSDQHPDIAQSLDNLAGIYENQARYQDAEEMHLEALAMREKLFGERHWYIAVSLNNLAALYHSQGRLSEAENNYSQALQISRLSLGHEHPYVAITLNNLASTYKDQGRYLEAEKTHLQTLQIRRELFTEEHLEVAQTLSNLGDVYLLQGRYLEAEKVYQQAYSIRKKLLTSEHPDIVLTLHNFAVLYTYQGRYQAAEKIYLQTLSLSEKIYGQHHPDYADNLNHLGGVYQQQGRYSEAEQKYLAALAIRKDIVGAEHADTLNSLNKIAELYRLQGRYSQAEALYLDIYGLGKRLLGEMHPDIAGILSNLGVLYDAQHKYSQAEKLFTEALLIVKSQFGDNHPQVASIMNNLATIVGTLGRYQEAEKIHLQVLEIRKSIFGAEHPNIANSFNNLAEVYLAQGQYVEAEKYYKFALSLRKKILGENHPDVAFSLNNLATLFAATQRVEEAFRFRCQASQIEDNLISNVFAFSSENERLAFIDKMRGSFDLFLSLIYQYLASSPTAIQAGFDFILKRKGLTAASLTAQNQAFYNGCYPHLSNKFQQLRELSNQIIHLTFSTEQRNNFDNYQTSLTQLQTQYDNLQKQIAAQVPEIQLAEQTPNRHAVASALPSNSVLIEFVYFDVFDFQAIPANQETQWQPQRYLAFILPAGQPNAVTMVDLGEAEKIDALIAKVRLQASEPRQETLAWGKLKTSKPQQRLTKLSSSEAIELSKLIFTPILTKVDKNKNQHLIFATDANLNLIPLQILPIEETGKKLLMDVYTVSYLGIGRDILHSPQQATNIADIPLIIADPDFDLIDEDSRKTKNNPPHQEFIETLDAENLSRATGTKFLAERVATTLKPSQLYTGAEALETHLINGKCPQILLIATHGLFIPDNQQIFNPMMRSALALAGANTWLSGEKLPNNAGKGIIFAQDIASLDLRANQLTVLSACDTARGDIKIGEGVFGLRRAFAIAGTKILIMSLWKVPDKATALLMERFFDNYQHGMEAVTALQNAQNHIRNIAISELEQSALGMEILTELEKVRGLSIYNSHDREKPLEHPFYWGAWICQGLD